MKIFLDTASIEDIKEYSHIIDGVTTNPSLIAKEDGAKELNEMIRKICSIIDGPISAEVVSTDAKGMVDEGIALSKLHKNVVVKIPMSEEGIKAAVELSESSINVNMTLVFTANQALLAARSGCAYVSPFVGRLDDIGIDGMKPVEEIVRIYRSYDISTKIIVASVRNPEHVKRAAMLGADIATVPTKILRSMFSHPLTDKGIKKFLEDWKGRGTSK